MLHLKNLHILFENKMIINALSFESRDNFINIYGENSSGKTILIEALLGLIEYNGDIFFGKHKITNLGEITNNIIYIGHSLSISQHLSVIDTLTLWANLYDSPLLIPASINYWGLENILQQPINQLSSGTIKKIELAKLLCCNSDFWILDEPSVNLDLSAQEKLKSLIKTKLESNGHVIYTSHKKLHNNCIAL